MSELKISMNDVAYNQLYDLRCKLSVVLFCFGEHAAGGSNEKMEIPTDEATGILHILEEANETLKDFMRNTEEKFSSENDEK